MAIIKKTALACALALTFISGTSSGADLFSFTQLNLPIPIRMNKSWYQVINSQQEWTEFFDSNRANIYTNGSEYRTLADIDFSNYTLVIGGLSGRTGVELSIDRILYGTNSTIVIADEVLPGPNCIVAQSITWPMRAILIRKTSGPITLYVERSYVLCN